MHAVFVHGDDLAIFRDFHDHGVEFDLDPHRFRLADKTLCVFGTGEFQFEFVQTETVVDTLI